MTKRDEISTRAKEILGSAPDGLRLRELRGRLRELFPDVPEGTIGGSIWNLHVRFPDEVCKPARGYFRLTKFRESDPDTASAGNEQQAKIGQKQRSRLTKVLFEAIPKDGTTISNRAALQKVQKVAKARWHVHVSKKTYFEIRNELIAEGRLAKRAGPGGRVCRIEPAGNEEHAKIGQKQRSKLAKILFDSIPKDGTSISNGVALRRVQKAAKASLNLDVSRETYFEIRNELIAKGQLGKGVGYGGSVHRIEGTTVASKTAKQRKKIAERALYEPLLEYIRQTWVPENEIKNFVLDKTAALGMKKTGGVWTRPDLSLVGIHTFTYIPGKTIELVTFEVKPTDDFRIEGVFETAAHSRATHRSYLMIHTPNGKPDTDKFQRLASECERFGLGLIIFGNPHNWETFETVQEAERRNPNAADVNAFIKNVMHKPQQESISEMVK